METFKKQENLKDKIIYYHPLYKVLEKEINYRISGEIWMSTCHITIHTISCCIEEQIICKNKFFGNL